MAQLSAIYELIGPDGTRVVFGNSTAASNDPDFIGYLNPEDGITGLDSAQVREVAEDNIDDDGGTHGRFLRGRRSVSFAGVLVPGSDIGPVLVLEEKLQRAADALDADATLSWTPESMARRRILVRQQNLRVTGRRPKGWFLGLVSASHLIEATVEKQVSGTSDSGLGTIATNLGTGKAHPRVTITGPLNGVFILENNGFPGSPYLLKTKGTRSLAAGQVLTVDFKSGQATINGAPAGSMIDFLGTSWAPLRPGTTSLTAYAGAQNVPWGIAWRDAWV